MFELEQLLAQIEQYYWPFLRMSAMFLAGPVFSAAAHPVRSRILLAVLVTVLVSPSLPPAPDVDMVSAAGVLAATRVLPTQ